MSEPKTTTADQGGSNYIACIEWRLQDGSLARRTNLNLRNVTITDMASATAAINYQFVERDGFEFDEFYHKDAYYITMLSRVDDLPHEALPSNNGQELAERNDAQDAH